MKNHLVVGQPSWRIAAGNVEAYVTRLGGHLGQELRRFDRQLVLSHVTRAEPTTLSRIAEFFHQQMVGKIIYWDESAPRDQGGLIPPWFVSTARPLHCLPTSLCSTVVTHFFATEALTPAEPFVACGSLIHVISISHHSVSNHLRFSTRRVPLTQRWPHYFVRASPFTRRLAKTADRIEFTFCILADATCYGLVVHFSCSPPEVVAPMQLLSVTGSSVSAMSTHWII